MTTMAGIYTRVSSFYTNVDMNLKRQIEDFARQHINVSGKQLDYNILEFIAKTLRLNKPLQFQTITYEEGIRYLKQERAKILEKSTKQLNTPAFIIENIKKMPNNRGYIWNNQEFTGEQPANASHARVLFEPRRGRTLIHVYEGKLHKIYEKLKGKREQILVSSEYMIPKVSVAKKVCKMKSKNPFMILYNSDSE